MNEVVWNVLAAVGRFFIWLFSLAWNTWYTAFRIVLTEWSTNSIGRLIIILIMAVMVIWVALIVGRASLTAFKEMVAALIEFGKALWEWFRAIGSRAGMLALLLITLFIATWLLHNYDTTVGRLGL